MSTAVDVLHSRTEQRLLIVSARDYAVYHGFGIVSLAADGRENWRWGAISWGLYPAHAHTIWDVGVRLASSASGRTAIAYRQLGWGEVHVLDERGRTLWSVLPTLRVNRMHFDGDVLVVSGEMPLDFGAADDGYHTVVAAYSADGIELWRFNDAAAAPLSWSRGSTIAATADDAHVLLDFDWAEPDGWRPRVSRLDAAHELDWHQDFTGHDWDDVTVGSFVVAGNGSADLAGLAYDDLTGTSSLRHARILADGGLGWVRTELPPGMTSLRRIEGLQTAANGGFEVLGTGSAAGIPNCVFDVTVDPNGQVSDSHCAGSALGTPSALFSTGRLDDGTLVGLAEWSNAGEVTKTAWQKSAGVPLVARTLPYARADAGELVAGDADEDRATLVLDTGADSYYTRVVGYQDGSLQFDRPAPTLGLGQPPDAATARHGGGVVVAWRDAGENDSIRFAAVSPDGTIAWSRRVEDFEGIKQPGWLVPMPDGSMDYRALGLDTLGYYGGGLLALRADGSERWRAQFDGTFLDTTLLAATSSGDTWVLAESGSLDACTLTRIDADGSHAGAWQIGTGDPVALSAASDGAVHAACADGSVVSADPSGPEVLGPCGTGGAGTSARTEGDRLVVHFRGANEDDPRDDALCVVEGNTLSVLAVPESAVQPLIDANSWYDSRIVPLQGHALLWVLSNSDLEIRIGIDASDDVAQPVLAIAPPRVLTNSRVIDLDGPTVQGHVVVHYDDWNAGEWGRVELQTPDGTLAAMLSDYAPVGEHFPRISVIDATGAPVTVGHGRTCIGLCPVAIAQYRLDVLFADDFE